MTEQTPILVPYGTAGSGTTIAVADATSIPANTSGLLLSGTNAGTARRIKTSSSGDVYVSSAATTSISDYSYPTFSVQNVGMTSGTSVLWAYVKVDALSTNKVGVREVWIRQTTTPVISSATLVTCAFQRGTTAPTTPTTTTPVAHDPNDTLDSYITTGYDSVTAGSIGSNIFYRYFLMWQVVPNTVNAITVERCAFGTRPIFSCPRGTAPFYIRPGQYFGLVITESNITQNITADVELVFTQEPA